LVSLEDNFIVNKDGQEPIRASRESVPELKRIERFGNLGT
jgi:hypothetical protein